jgi:hypothetical protein
VRTGLVTGMGAVAIVISIMGFRRCLREVGRAS